MRKRDHLTVVRRGIAVIVILLLFLLLLGAFAPVAMAADWPNCNWIQNTSCDNVFPPNSSCVSEDGRIYDAWLGNCTTGAKLEPCTLGTSVKACVLVKFKAGPDRYQVYPFFDLYIDDQYDGSYCTCYDLIGTSLVNRTIYGPILWTCGQEVELKNILVAWSVDKDCNCSVPACCNKSCDCQHGHPKCWGPKDIIVRAPLVANFTFDNVCFCTYTTFTDKTTGGHGSYTYDWDFDDGNSSNAQNPTHHYGKNGTYNVTLTVTDSASPPNSDSQSYDVTVYPTPTANFTSNSPQIYCLNITFTDTTTNGTLSYKNWSWDFGDGNGSYEQNPRHLYGDSGTYDVNLTVTDANNCTNSTINQVVASDYNASIKIVKSASPTSATVGDVITYSYVVTNIGNINLTGVTVTDSNLGTVILNRTHLEPTWVANGTLLYTVNQSDVCANITNTPDVTESDGFGDPVTYTCNLLIVTTDS